MQYAEGADAIALNTGCVAPAVWYEFHYLNRRKEDNEEDALRDSDKQIQAMKEESKNGDRSAPLPRERVALG